MSVVADARKSVRVLGGGAVVAAAVGAALVAAPSAQAVTCAAPPGSAASVTQLDGRTACGAVADAPSGAWAHGDGGVGFADARTGARVLAAGLSGGAGAGEARGGSLATLGFGEDALALGIVEEPATAVVVAGPQSQAFIGDLRDPVLCEGSAATAVNLTTGRGCVVLGTFRYVTP
ncbi:MULTISPECIES: DUF6764 family protein [Rhodococcus]|uniref:Protein kinase n=2 Tax=Rhodococcus TaxID=1827 RepID=A0AA46NWH6_9NOCA|nr:MULTISPECIES: DUF6764 family protein [Rhodococcus]AKE91666.1 hypothetical protein AAT18_23205 [Rhodococcus aetherivorans]MBC2589525.1 hypothetical protein [Rhodococcus aetherivorans]QIX52267.1 hypothetical protein HFP48_23875 [Rhodococcus sp. DMU1]QRI77476.1 hypothetical protein JQ505_06930 [Rhodococcus aetherivorans]QSE60895.1 hypothetical protein JYA75_08040 [Rhodococcus sp. PSBB066]